MPRLDLKGDRRAGRKIGKAFESLVALQARLRAPNGCPWDREQTHDSLRKYLVEETYEVLDALDSGDPRKFADELGDLLLQVVFHSELAAEAREVRYRRRHRAYLHQDGAAPSARLRQRSRGHLRRSAEELGAAQIRRARLGELANERR